MITTVVVVVVVVIVIVIIIIIIIIIKKAEHCNIMVGQMQCPWEGRGHHARGRGRGQMNGRTIGGG